MYKIILFVAFCILSFPLLGQKHNVFKSGFTIKEKKSKDSTNTLLIGNLNFQNKENKISYSIIFPEKETWILQDSFLSVGRNDSIYSSKKIDNMNQFMMFKQILDYKENDFGLTELGFNIDKVEEIEEGSIKLTWTPPPSFATFLKHIITISKDNLLQAVITVDVDDMEINKTFYDDYKIITDLPVPHKISSHFKSTKEEIFKSITFRNVTIE